MKKFVIIFILTAVCQTSFGQNAESLFNHFKDKQGVESVNISPFMMKFARLFMNNENKNNPIIKGVNSMKVLDLENSSQKEQEQFAKEVNKLELNGYETWIQAKENGENVKIIARVKDDVVCELLVLTTGDSDCALVMMKGKIKREDIQTIIDDDKVMIDGRK